MGERRILVVEDDANQRGLLRAFLELDGYRVEEVSDAEAAWSRLADRAPDLVITDERLPGAPGSELVRRMRVDPRFARIPVLLCSALDEERIRSRVPSGEGEGEGRCLFVRKPYAAERLGALVRGILDAPQRGEEGLSGDGAGVG